PSVKDNDGLIDSRLAINSTPLSSQRIENNNQFEDDTPLYSVGTVQTLTNDSITFSVQGKETGNSSIQTQDSVTFSPSTVVNDASVGAVAWINPAKATVSDDDYAVHNRASGAGYSNY